jgi:Family of unknown function (DUF5898)
MRCSFQKICLTKNVDLNSFVDFAETNEIYLFHHLGSGESGACCLAMTKNGEQCCVVKFFLMQARKTTGRKLAAQELENSNKVYGSSLPQCCVGYLINEDGYICMPYLKPVQKCKRLTRIQDGSVKKALTLFAKSGFKHEEIDWRHVGQFGKELYLLDLGDITKFGADDDKEKWIDSSIEKLRKRCEVPPSSPPVVPTHPTFAHEHAGGGLDSMIDHQQQGGITIGSVLNHNQSKVGNKRSLNDLSS